MLLLLVAASLCLAGCRAADQVEAEADDASTPAKRVVRHKVFFLGHVVWMSRWACMYVCLM